MAITLLNAMKTKYTALTAGFWPNDTKWRFDYGEIAPRDSSGNAISLPYIVFTFPEKITPEYQSDAGGWESGTMDVTFTHTDETELEQATRAFKYNGAAPNLRSGFDWGTLAFSAPNYNISLKRTGESLSYRGETSDTTIRRVYSVTLSYAIVMGLDATATPVE